MTPRIKLFALSMTALLSVPVAAQDAGWSFALSPTPGRRASRVQPKRRGKRLKSTKASETYSPISILPSWVRSKHATVAGA